MPTLSILVPVYNEERTLASVMQRLASVFPEAQIVYVNDGSKDGSLSLLRQHARPQDLVLDKPNGGKGSAIRLGLEKASGDYAVIQDADLEYDPQQINMLFTRALQEPGIAVFGSRFLQDNPNIYKRYLLGNKVLTAAMNILFLSRLTDSYTCYKLLPTGVFRSLKLQSNGFEMEAEICARCLRDGIRIVELPISYKPRTLEEGKKIRWQDAVTGLLMMLKIRLRRRGSI